MTLSLDELRAAPKVALHDHLDGGLRPGTVLDLADRIGHRLPATDPEVLAAWFHDGADRRDLTAYLQTFQHTVAVLQHADHLERVAYEAGIDLADDGVVYAELRYAPELNTRAGLTYDEVLEATTSGFDQAMRERDIVLRTIVTAMRTDTNAAEAAEVAVRWRDRGVVGFDLAGAEAGYPPSAHLDAIRTVQAAGLQVTLHAGEAYGLPSIREAVEICGARRLGHGVRLVDDVAGDWLGPVAQRVLDEQVALEMCPSSNVHTGAVDSLAEHPADQLRRLGFAVTINTDNRLMSNTTATQELGHAVATWGWGVDEVGAVLRNAADHAFCSDVERAALQARVNAWVAATA
jgi:adenosine deaminase